MRISLLLGFLAVLVVGCGSQSSSPPATPTQPALTPTPTPRPPTPAPATPRPTVVISRSYAAFLETVCHALARQNANTLINALPYYQYNSGLRYGWYGDGEGQTGDPSLMRTWLSGTHVTCHSFTPGSGGHGTLLTSGWDLQNGRWSLLDLDTYGGQWKINDFTFGDRRTLMAAMQVNHPIVQYHG